MSEDALLAAVVFLCLVVGVLWGRRKPKHRYDRTHARIWRDQQGVVHIVETKKPEWANDNWEGKAD